MTSFRRRGGCLLTLGGIASALVLAGMLFGTQETVLAKDSSPIEAWVADHQVIIAGAVFGTVLVVSLVLWLLTLQSLPAADASARVAPERVSPAVAYAAATRREPYEQVVLPVLLDLIDRGFYDATLEQPRPDGGPVDLVLAKPSRRPTEPTEAFERDLISVFDGLLGGRPGQLTTLHTRVPEGSEAARQRWRALRTSLAELSHRELQVDRNLRPVRNGLVLIAAAVLIAGIVLAQRHTSDVFAFFVAGPITLAIALVVPSRYLATLEPASLERHARWKAYAEGLGRRRHDGPPARVPAEAWSRDLALALAFSEVDAHWGAFAPAPEGIHWAATLGDAKLIMLDHHDAAAAFGNTCRERFDPPPPSD